MRRHVNIRGLAPHVQPDSLLTLITVATAFKGRWKANGRRGAHAVRFFAWLGRRRGMRTAPGSQRERC